MITLRRFNYPTVDNIIDPKVYDYKSKQLLNADQPDLARAVTWMSENAGNKLEDIIKWNNKYNWKEIESEVQTLVSKAQGIQGSKALGIGTTGFTSLNSLSL